MKMQPDRLDGVNVITRLEPGCIWVNGKAWSQSVLVPWQGACVAWSSGAIADLTQADFERVALLRPEIVIFGSGPKISFAHPSLMAPLHALRIGVETMDSAAASRTFNVLATEGRQVVAALLLQPPTG
jgi:uncharacterized protein